MDAGSAKKQTLREAIAQCEKGQAEIWAHLTNNFNRQPKEEAKPIGIPSHPNVLDEFIDRLIALNQAQKWTIAFLIERVNSKL